MLPFSLQPQTVSIFTDIKISHTSLIQGTSVVEQSLGPFGSGKKSHKDGLMTDPEESEAERDQLEQDQCRLDDEQDQLDDEEDQLDEEEDQLDDEQDQQEENVRRWDLRPRSKQQTVFWWKSVGLRANTRSTRSQSGQKSGRDDEENLRKRFCRMIEVQSYEGGCLIFIFASF